LITKTISTVCPTKNDTWLLKVMCKSFWN